MLSLLHCIWSASKVLTGFQMTIVLNCPILILLHCVYYHKWSLLQYDQALQLIKGNKKKNLLKPKTVFWFGQRGDSVADSLLWIRDVLLNFDTHHWSIWFSTTLKIACSHTGCHTGAWRICSPKTCESLMQSNLTLSKQFPLHPQSKLFCYES